MFWSWIYRKKLIWIYNLNFWTCLLFIDLSTIWSWSRFNQVLLCLINMEMYLSSNWIGRMGQYYSVNWHVDLKHLVKMCQSSIIVLLVFLALTSHSLSKFHETQGQNADENMRFPDILQRRSEIRSMIKTVFRGQSLLKNQYVDSIIPPGHQCPRNCHLRRGKCVRNLTPKIPC